MTHLLLQIHCTGPLCGKCRERSANYCTVFRAILNSDGLAKHPQHERARDCIEAERKAKEATCSTK